MSTQGSSYNDSNRAFLQAFLARSTLTFEEAQPILAAILTVHEKRRILATDVSEAIFKNYVTIANHAILPFDLEIRHTKHQLSGKATYSLISSTDNPITSLATSYTADEISYLKRVLDFMFETNNTAGNEIMAITAMDAVRLAKDPNNNNNDPASCSYGESSQQTVSTATTATETKGSSGQSLTMAQAQKMLDNLHAEGWFEKSVKGFYSLTPRALMELRGWLIDTYNEVEGDKEGKAQDFKIKSCFSCNEIITVGQRCPKTTCACRLHDICIERVFRVQKSTKCPVCKTTDWKDNKSFVGERVLTTSSTDDEHL